MYAITKGDRKVLSSVTTPSLCVCGNDRLRYACRPAGQGRTEVPPDRQRATVQSCNSQHFVGVKTIKKNLDAMTLLSMR